MARAAQSALVPAAAGRFSGRRFRLADGRGLVAAGLAGALLQHGALQHGGLRRRPVLRGLSGLGGHGEGGNAQIGNGLDGFESRFDGFAQRRARVGVEFHLGHDGVVSTGHRDRRD
jgi:hypothetical protein